MNKEPVKLVILSSGTPTGGGSGARKLVEYQRFGKLRVGKIIIVSNNLGGGVKKVADDFELPFIHLLPPFDEAKYDSLLKMAGCETTNTYFALSGWLKMVRGLPAHRTFNIHPGPLPLTAGLYGHHVHERCIELYKAGKITASAVSMHFVPDNAEYDSGPVFFHYPVPIYPDDTPDTLGVRVNSIEHAWQWWATDLVVNNTIWYGSGPMAHAKNWYMFGI